MSDRWYVAKRAGGPQQSQGPVSFEQLRRLAAAGDLRPEDLLWQEGTEGWRAAEDFEGLVPTAPPRLPPLPPPDEATGPSVRHTARSRARPPDDPSPSRSLSPVVLIVVACLAGGCFLLFALCAGVAMIQPSSPANLPGGPTAGPVGASPGGVALQGTSQRRSNDGTAMSAYITFSPDGRFVEQGFLNAAVVQRQYKTADGQVWQDWGDPRQGGQGTYRFAGTTLELTYTTGATSRMNCAALDGGGRELVINTHYTFVRVR